MIKSRSVKISGRGKMSEKRKKKYWPKEDVEGD